MDEDSFREFLAAGLRTPKGLTQHDIDANIRNAKGFEAHLEAEMPPKTIISASQDDLDEYVRELIHEGKNTEETLLALLRYARFAGNRAVELAVMTLLDGASVLRTLQETIRDRTGQVTCEAIFRGIELPTLGSPPRDWPPVTKRFMDQMESSLDEQTCRDILLTGPHAGPPEWYSAEREAYLKAKDIDDFLRRRHEDALDVLRKHMAENTLFYNQEIDRNVIDFVASNQEIMGGVRRGDIIFETKIPYMTREYLRETDETMKRYYYCHCPWVREAIRTGCQISPNFCYCSAGYHKKPWEVILGKPLEAEVLSSVLKGDNICRFAIRIPTLTAEKDQP